MTPEMAQTDRPRPDQDSICQLPIDVATIQVRITELAADIRRDFEGQRLTLLAVLRGT